MKEFAHVLAVHISSYGERKKQKARVALGYASSYSYAFFVLFKLPACIHNSISMNKFLSYMCHACHVCMYHVSTSEKKIHQKINITLVVVTLALLPMGK